MSNLRKWADEHQYDAEAQPGATEHNGVMPSVHLIEMPDDPLGVLAAQNGIYVGKVFRSLSEVTDHERRKALEDMMKTTLQSPLEAIKMHWLFEGVDRAFTHQHVRQRTANFGQESLRFSVMGNLIDATTLPPDLHGTKRVFGVPFDHELGAPDSLSFDKMIGSHWFTFASQDERNRAVWDWCVWQINEGYTYLAEHGIAAEEARGLLPHATATRIHYQTDLRGLMKVMGERLCTQAQFHWRMVAALVRDAIRNYTPDFSYDADPEMAAGIWAYSHRWQFELLADSGIFRPVCYQTGKCMFEASADRGCTIRERVEWFGNHGVPSDRWNEVTPVFIELDGGQRTLSPISPTEWLLDPAAARTKGEPS